MRNIFIIFLLFISHISYSQFVKKETILIPKTKSGELKKVFHKIQSDTLITSAAFKTNPKNVFNNSYVVTPSDTFYLSQNNENENDIMLSSNLIIFPKPVKTFYLYTSNIKDSIQIFLINDKTNIKKSAIKVSSKKKIPVLKCLKW